MGVPQERENPSTPLFQTEIAGFQDALRGLVQRASRVAAGGCVNQASSGSAQGGGDVVVGFVPTMGALHSGHGALLQRARESCDILIASVFVNPLQFDDPHDYQHYPRDIVADQQFLGTYGVDLIFAPDVEQMYPGYPDAPQILVSTGALGRRWEGTSRPGHFDGVATVVTKLFTILQTAIDPMSTSIEAWFGEKDAEQLVIIQQLVHDLNMVVRIRALPIIRDAQGLALSSRNQRLSAEDYQDALELPRALTAIAEAAQRGATGGASRIDQEVKTQRERLEHHPRIQLDYLVVVDPVTLVEIDEADRTDALLLIAAQVGPVRLIDNRRI